MTSKMAEPRERPLHELLSRDMVDIYVGPENTHWVLHEKLLCHRSPFFRKIFYNKKGSKNSTYGLPDDEDEPFKLFVGWLYAETLPQVKEEKDLAPLFDLYLMAERWEIRKLVVEVLEVIRTWYHESDTWPGLRRVQYVYSNTEAESPMRQLLVSCVARMLVVGDNMPPHWEKALRKNGQMAVDIIMCVQQWRIEPDSVPDSRHGSVQSMVNEAEDKRGLVDEGEREDEKTIRKIAGASLEGGEDEAEQEGDEEGAAEEKQEQEQEEQDGDEKHGETSSANVAAQE